MLVFNYTKVEHGIKEAYCQPRFSKQKSNILNVPRLTKYNLEVKEITNSTHELICHAETEGLLSFSYQIEFRMNEDVNFATWKMIRNTDFIKQKPEFVYKTLPTGVEFSNISSDSNYTQCSVTISIDTKWYSPNQNDRFFCTYSSENLSDYRSNYWYPFKETIISTTPSNPHKNSAVHFKQSSFLTIAVFILFFVHFLKF